ncbi:redox-sensitive bicupin YhaK (pirin superfamily) [Neisseria perflava]|nr:redox-sensitive bicupin YhaK (pirin superfamily) [Neisseria perflava]
MHEEFHAESFGKRGGLFEMAQLWINLPAAHKSTPPRYQHLTAADIPVVELAGGAGSLRLIAGERDGVKGTAETFTELNVWDVKLNPNGAAELTVPAKHNLTIAVRRGNVRFNDEAQAGATQLVTFNNEEGAVRLQTDGEGAELLLLSSVPIDEPIAAYDPFVMNTRAELVQAFADYNNGKFGHLA